MSFDHDHPGRKNWRKPYRKSKRFDRSCHFPVSPFLSPLHALRVDPRFFLAERCKLDELGDWDTHEFQRSRFRPLPIPSLAEPKEHDQSHDAVGLRCGARSAARV